MSPPKPRFDGTWKGRKQYRNDVDCIDQQVKDAAAWGEIIRLPTILHVRCHHCRHEGRVELADNQINRRFKCSRCGASGLF